MAQWVRQAETDQTVCMRRLIGVFCGHHYLAFAAPRLKFNICKPFFRKKNDFTVFSINLAIGLIFETGGGGLWVPALILYK